MQFKLNALRSVVTSDLSPSDEYAVSSCEEVAFFVRHFHGALRRHRETNVGVIDEYVEYEDEGDESGPQKLSTSTTAAILPFLFELLHLSQFQHVNVAGRLNDAALGLLEDVSAELDWAPALAPLVEKALRGCLDANCEVARKHGALRGVAVLQLKLPACTELCNLAATLVHPPSSSGAWKKKPLLELSDAIGRCSFRAAIQEPRGALVLFAMEASAQSSSFEERLKSLQYPECYLQVANLLAPWATGRRKRWVLAPNICRLLCLCPAAWREIGSAAKLHLDRNHSSGSGTSTVGGSLFGGSITTAGGAAPVPAAAAASKLVVELYKSLGTAAHGALNTEVALTCAVVFARFAATMSHTLRGAHANNYNASAWPEEEDNNKEESSLLLDAQPVLPLLELVKLSEKQVQALLLPRRTDGLDGSASSTGYTGGICISHYSGSSDSSGEFGLLSADLLDCDFVSPFLEVKDIDDIGHGRNGGLDEPSRWALAASWLEAQYSLQRRRLFTEIAPQCLNGTCPPAAAAALLTALVRIVSAPVVDFKSDTAPRVSVEEVGVGEDDERANAEAESERKEVLLRAPWRTPEGLQLRDALLDTFFQLSDGYFAVAAQRWPGDTASYPADDRVCLYGEGKKLLIFFA